MAQHLDPKTSAETVTRKWTVAVQSGDAVSGVSASGSGVTATGVIEGDEVVFTVSGGTEGQTGLITATFTTDNGDTLEEAFYIPVIAPEATGMTVQDAVSFALRKVYGLGEDAPADASDDAVERLQDMLYTWKATGADVGATFPLESSTVIYCKPEYQLAIKNNLAVQIADQYGMPLTSVVAVNAVRGLQLIKNDNLPNVRVGVSYF